MKKIKMGLKSKGENTFNHLKESNIKVLFIVNSSDYNKVQFVKNFNIKEEINHYGINVIGQELIFEKVNDSILDHLANLFMIRYIVGDFNHFFQYDELWEELVFTNNQIRNYISSNFECKEFGAVVMIDLKNGLYDFVWNSSLNCV